MKTVQWQMKEHFVFPTSTGLPTGAETVKVTPRFTIDRTKDSVRLTGIYHLAVNVKFNLEVSLEVNTESAILIDDVDVNGNLGYFEYAVPFNIDLPPEANDPLNIVTTNATSELEGHGVIGIIWDVECSYKEVVVIQEISDSPTLTTLEPEGNEKVVSTMKHETEEASEDAAKTADSETGPKYESVSFSDSDEVLSFIAGLDDGVGATLFRSNDVPVQSKS